jgi:flagellar protein FlbD
MRQKTRSDFGMRGRMIHLTRLNGKKYYLNAGLIQTVEGTPDTVITLTNDVKLLVKDSPESVVQKIIEYQRLVHNPELDTHLGA